MATNTGMGECCLSGRLGQGTPTGREETIGGLPTYVAEPKAGGTAQSIIILTDIFGWQFKNVRLLADSYAINGSFTVYVPDVHSGNSLPESFLQSVEPPLKTQETLSTIDKAKNTANVAATLGPWLISHREAVSKPIIDGFINTVKTIPGTNKVGALGFCWGGRYAILAAHGEVDAAVAMHPSLLGLPADLEGLTKPLSVGLGDKDSLVDASQRGQIQDVLGKKTDVAHELRIYEGQVHGFSLRGDWSSEKDKEAMDEAEKQGVEWFKKYLA